MAGYEKRPTRYSFGSKSFATTDIIYITGPKGKRGYLVDYGVDDVTVAFTNTTTAAAMSVGTAAAPASFGAAFSLGAPAIDAGSKSVRSTYQQGAQAAFETYVLPGVPIPADTKVAITCTGPTGGTPAGTASPFVEIRWED